MQRKRSHKATRRLIAAIALLAFAARALIPQGFMPAADGLLHVRICPEGLRAQLPARAGHRTETQSHSEHCAFASASVTGPLPHQAPQVLGVAAQEVPQTRFRSIAVRIHLFHLPYARAPPLAA